MKQDFQNNFKENSFRQKLITASNLVNDRMAELLDKMPGKTNQWNINQSKVNPLNKNQLEESKTDQKGRDKLLQAMRYSAICDGKRIRPFLVIKVFEMFKDRQIDRQNADSDKSVIVNADAGFDAVLNIACALEFIHIYSLIHDDLPAMDDDDFRRGQLTCHKKFDEATAILAGDTLLTYAFEILSDDKMNIEAKIKCQIINIIAKAIGFNGMAGGQMFDLYAKKFPPTIKQIFELHHLKTGRMLIAAVEIGAVLAGANQSTKGALISYATDIGLAFQIQDDVLDYKENEGQLASDPTSIVHLIGLENANLQLQKLKESAIFSLETFGSKADSLKELADFIVSRQV